MVKLTWTVVCCPLATTTDMTAGIPCSRSQCFFRLWSWVMECWLVWFVRAWPLQASSPVGYIQVWFTYTWQGKLVFSVSLKGELSAILTVTNRWEGTRRRSGPCLEATTPFDLRDLNVCQIVGPSKVYHIKKVIIYRDIFTKWHLCSVLTNLGEIWQHNRPLGHHKIVKGQIVSVFVKPYWSKGQDLPHKIS